MRSLLDARASHRSLHSADGSHCHDDLNSSIKTTSSSRCARASRSVVDCILLGTIVSKLNHVCSTTVPFAARHGAQPSSRTDHGASFSRGIVTENSKWWRRRRFWVNLARCAVKSPPLYACLISHDHRCELCGPGCRAAGVRGSRDLGVDR